MTTTLEIRRPDDWHVHLRDGAWLNAVLPATAGVFARAIVMPNLDPPVTTTALAIAYRNRIVAALGAHASFTPLMTCYLTDATAPDDLRRGWEEQVFAAAKLYPAGATFQSHRGVTAVHNIHRALETMQRIGMPLCVHGEVADPAVDVFDREAVFIERVLEPLQRDFPKLKVVFEHVTTADAVDYVRARPRGTAATITPHHLMINRNHLFEGGLRPHHYCLPVAKRERHRLALRRAATSGDVRFFLGTDSAPHDVRAKEAACGCAGIFNAPVAIACYAQVFDEEGALDKLQGFASEHGAAFYGLPKNHGALRLTKAQEPVKYPVSAVASGGEVLIFAPPGGLFWQVL
jgi:dihydroorotase